VEAYQELQCAPGYSGNLCSNCDRRDRVTQTVSHTCRSCGVSRAGSIVLFVLLRLFDLSVVLLSVFLVFKERHRRNMAVNGGLVSADEIREAMQQGTVVKVAPGVQFALSAEGRHSFNTFNVLSAHHPSFRPSYITCYLQEV
jgi:hypothetical protein